MPEPRTDPNMLFGIIRPNSGFSETLHTRIRHLGGVHVHVASYVAIMSLLAECTHFLTPAYEANVLQAKSL